MTNAANGANGDWRLWLLFVEDGVSPELRGPYAPRTSASRPRAPSSPTAALTTTACSPSTWRARSRWACSPPRRWSRERMLDAQTRACFNG